MAFLGAASTSNYLLTDSVPMTPTQNLTIMCWAYYDTTSETGRLYMIGRDGTNGYGAGIGLNNDSSAGNETLHVFDGVAWIDPNVVAGTGWRHIAVVDRGGQQFTYLDGQFVGGVDVANAVAATQNTTVGVAFDTVAGSALSADNRVAHIKAWNRALGTAEVETEMRSGFPVFFDGLTMYWELGRSPGNLVGTASAVDFTQRFVNGNATGTPIWADNPPVARC